MPELAVHTPALWARDGPAPTLRVIHTAGRWCAVEVAVTTERLAAIEGPGGGAGWASWKQGMVRPGSITIPDDAWATLKNADRLYYRAHSTSAPDAWVDHEVTVSDELCAMAPSFRVCDCWSSGLDHDMESRVPEVLAVAAKAPEFDLIDSGARLAALVCLHRFSPRRPSDPSRVEWVVVLASDSLPLGEVRVLVQRLEFTSLSVVASRMFVDPGSLNGNSGSTAGRFLAAAAGAEAVLWPRQELGPFLILRDNSPAPEDEGGTCVVLPDTGRCVYSARTKWHGAPVVTTPE